MLGLIKLFSSLTVQLSSNQIAQQVYSCIDYETALIKISIDLYFRISELIYETHSFERPVRLSKACKSEDESL